MKSYLHIWKSAILFLLLFSCETESELVLSDSALKNSLKVEPVKEIIMAPVPECPLTTRFLDWQNLTLTLGQVKTFSIQTYPNSIYQWTTTGSAIIITSSTTSNQVTIKANALGTASLSVTRDANEGGTCGRTGSITVVAPGGGGDDGGDEGGGENPPPCPCPAQFIDDQLCVSGGHPYWRFQLTGTMASDVIYWYGSHITLLSGQGGTYAIANPTDPNNGYFTLYCRVTRQCADGTSKTRTAYYTNYYGGSCGAGTTGFINTCGPIID